VTQPQVEETAAS